EKADAGEKKEEHKNRSVTIQVNDGKYTARQEEDGVRITVTGTVDDGKVAVEQIRINDGESTKTYKQLSDVPEKHRGAVKRLIANADDSPVRFRTFINKVGN